MNWTSIEDAIHTWVVASSGLPAGQVIWSEQEGPRPPQPYITVALTALQRLGHDWSDVEDNPLTFADDTVESVDTGADTLTLTAHGLLSGDGPVRFSTTGTLPSPLAIDTDYWVIRVDDDNISVAASFVDAIAATAIDLTTTGSGTHTISDTDETTRAGQEIIHSARGVRFGTIELQCFAQLATGASRAAALLNNVKIGLALPSARDTLRAAGVGVSSFEPITPISAVLGASQWEPRAVMTARYHAVSELTETGTYIETAEISRET